MPHVAAAAIAIQARIPLLLWGESGIGKTAIIQAMADDSIHEPMWAITLSYREPTDQGGLPIITKDGVRLEPPAWGKALAKGGRGIVFFDELNTARPQTQASALRVVQEREIGELSLPDDTSFVAACNPPETYPGTYRLTPSMANRWCHISWPINEEGWCHGMLAGFPSPEVPRLPATWTHERRDARALISSYISVHRNALHNRPSDPYEAGRAWPSNRTWTMAADLLAACRALGHDVRSEIFMVLLTGCVGAAAARQFRKWTVALDLRDPEEYFRDPKKTALPKRQDQIRVTLDSLVSAAVAPAPKQKRIRRCSAAWVVLDRVAKRKPDLAVPSAHVLAVNMPEELCQPGKIPPSVDSIQAILEKAQVDYREGRR